MSSCAVYTTPILIYSRRCLGCLRCFPPRLCQSCVGYTSTKRFRRSGAGSARLRAAGWNSLRNCEKLEEGPRIVQLRLFALSISSLILSANDRITSNTDSDEKPDANAKATEVAREAGVRTLYAEIIEIALPRPLRTARGSGERDQSGKSPVSPSFIYVLKRFGATSEFCPIAP